MVENVSGVTVEGRLAARRLAIASPEAELRLEQIAEALFGLASLDFTARHAIRGDGSVIDAIAGCINMLSEELGAHLEEHRRIERELEDRVHARTAELSSRNADMRLLLDNVEQGFFTVDRSGAMSPEHSAILAGWFGPVEPEEPIHRYFGRHHAAFGLEMELGWQQVSDDILPLAVALDQLPKRLVASGRRYRFSYIPIGAGAGERLLVVVSDETHVVEHDALQREKKETLALFEHMLADRSGFIGFMDEAAEIVTHILPMGSEDLVRRALHTLKGNAALFGLHSVAEMCHALETQMAEERTLPDAAAVAGLKERWSRLSEQVDRMLGKGRHLIEVSVEQYAELERAASGDATRAQVLTVVQSLKMDPVERRLQHFAEQASRIGRRLGKEISVSVSDEGLRLDPRRWSKVWQAFVHAVRNAVDHGIEPGDEREAAGKPRAGHIALRARRAGAGAGVVIEIEDDGRGIRWDDLRHRAGAQGLPTATPQDLTAALFVGGVSTAPAVTELSGRGVGMAALKSAVQDAGGRLELESQVGRGTLLRLCFPDRPATPRRTPPVGVTIAG